MCVQVMSMLTKTRLPSAYQIKLCTQKMFFFFCFSFFFAVFFRKPFFQSSSSTDMYHLQLDRNRQTPNFTTHGLSHQNSRVSTQEFTGTPYYIRISHALQR